MQKTQETRIQFLGQKDPREKEMATHSSILAGIFPWTEEPGGLPSMGLHRVGHDWSDLVVVVVVEHRSQTGGTKQQKLSRLWLWGPAVQTQDVGKVGSFGALEEDYIPRLCLSFW